MDNKHTNFSFDLTDLEKITEENLGFSALSDGLGFRPKEKKIHSKQEAPLLPHAAIETPVLEKKSEPSIKENLSEVAPLSQRMLAMLFDTIVVGSIVIFAFLWAGNEPIYEFTDNIHYSAVLFFVLIGGYFIIAESMGGQSLGKMVFGLVIVEDDKYRKPIGFQTAFRRFAFFCASMIPLGYGLFISLLDSKYRAWHDRLTTSVVERKRN